MILKRVPPSILVALGLGCGPSTGSDEESSLSACLSPPYDTGTEVGPCLSECLGMLPETSEDVATSACLDVSGCLSPPEETDTSDGGFISASSDGSSDSGTSGTGSSGSDASGSDSSGSGSTEGGSDSSTSGGTQDASPRARAWHDALAKIGGTLPTDVLAKLRAQKGPR